MSAFVFDLNLKCEYAACQSRATVGVRNTFNEPCGQFCRKHGKARLAGLQRAEAAMVKSTVAARRSA